MAILSSCTPKKVHKPTEQITMTIDSNILEHIYSATLDEILKDDGLMSIILSNGYYRAALAEASECAELHVKTKEGKDEVLTAPAPEQPMIYDLIMRNTKYSTPGLKLLNHDFIRADEKQELSNNIESIQEEEMISMGKYGDIPISNGEKTGTDETEIVDVAI